MFFHRYDAQNLLANCHIFAAIVAQRIYYGNAPPQAALDDEDLEQALALAEE